MYILFNFQPILEHELLMARPLLLSDFEALRAIAADPLIWTQHPVKDRSEPEGFRVFFDEAMACGKALTVIHRETGEIMGSSRYHRIPGFDNAIEIGWTFLGRQYWGGGYNSALKSIMLDHAFRYVNYVVLYANENNFRSQRAIGKIGGVLVTEIEGQTLPIKPQSTLRFLVKKPQVDLPLFDGTYHHLRGQPPFGHQQARWMASTGR